MTKVDVVIVNWNTGSLLAKCLASLSHLPERTLIGRVIVVDNNSSDDSIGQAEALASPLAITFFKLKENIGFARGNNVGIRKLTGQHHLLLLNPDTEVQPGALRELVEALGELSQAGIVGAKLLNSDRTDQPSVRRFPKLINFIWLALKINRLWPGAKSWSDYMQTSFDYSKRQAVDQVMGAVFLIRAEARQAIGLLDENFWVWFEEVDYCQRAASAGWQTWYVPEATVIHHGGVSFKQLVGLKRAWLWTVSSIQYAHKHLGWLAAVVLIALAPLGLLMALPASLVHGRKKGMTKQRL